MQSEENFMVYVTDENGVGGTASITMERMDDLRYMLHNATKVSIVLHDGHAFSATTSLESILSLIDRYRRNCIG